MTAILLLYAIGENSKNMKVEIEDITVSYPNEETAIHRRLVIFDDSEYLQFNIFKKLDTNSVGGLTFTKQQRYSQHDAQNNLIQ